MRYRVLDGALQVDEDLTTFHDTLCGAKLKQDRESNVGPALTDGRSEVVVYKKLEIQLYS